MDSKRNPQTKWIRYADLIIANSNATANSVSKIINKEKIKVVMNGIKIDEFVQNNKNRMKIREYLNIPVDSIVICNVGRICKQKNQSEIDLNCFRIEKQFGQSTLYFCWASPRRCIQANNESKNI